MFLNNYEIIEEVGRGGMGIVYRAKDKRLGRIIAIKELLIDKGITGKERTKIIERFHREAQTAASLSHPNIVTIFDIGESENRHFIAMEFLHGKTLKDFLEGEISYNLNELINIFIQIAEGLDHAHSMKVIHRDIKPANITILPKNNTVKIMDFGLARSEYTSSLTQDGEMFGTLGYISPEQLTNTKNVDSRADIFSFGCMMYELLTNKLPFYGDNIGAIVLNILKKEPKSICEIKPDIPKDLENIILKCLIKDPNMRYQKAEEILKDLENVKNYLNKQQNVDLLHSIQETKPSILDGKTEIMDSRSFDTNKTMFDNTVRFEDIKITSPSLEKQVKKLLKGQKVFIEEELKEKTFFATINWETIEKCEPEVYIMLLSETGKMEKEEDFIFYNNSKSLCGSLEIISEEFENYKRKINIDLNKIEPNISKIKFILSVNKDAPIFSVSSLKNLNINIFSELNRDLIFQIEDLGIETILVLIEIYKRNDKWKLMASGNGYKSNLLDFFKKYASSNIQFSE